LSIGKNDGIIIGETDDHEIITLPMDTYLNKNIAVFGSSGSKKSRGFAIPNGIELAQEELQKKIKREMSLVFTDPKGELYRKLTKYLETKGYDVKVFNLVNPTYSNAANFIKFVEDETDAQIFSQIVIEGTQLARKSGGDEFWNRGEQNLLKALLLYVINYVEKEEDKSIGFIYDVLASGNIKQIDKLFFDTSGPTRLSYNIYAQATDIVKQSVVTGLATRLQVFQTDKIRNITNKDEISFEDIGNKKTCVFVVTSDTNSAFDYLSTLFFTFLFIKLIKQADENPDGRLEDAVLFLEGCHSNIIQWNAMLEQYNQMNAFNKAIVFGYIYQLQQIEENEKMIVDELRKINSSVPVVKTNDFGHMHANSIIPIGAEVIINANNQSMVINDYLK
jgi:TRAG protein